MRWKDTASYYTPEVGGDENKMLPGTSPMAKGLKDRLAFWRGLEVVK